MARIEISAKTLPLNVPVRIEHPAAALVVVRTEESISAFADSCPHAQWRLSDGQVNSDVLECPGHGWEFNLFTGRCLNVPAYCLKSYDVSAVDEMVQIDLGEPSLPSQTSPARCVANESR